MLVSEFDYYLPPELIAQHPLPKREQSRMMVVKRDSGDITHSHFSHFPYFLNDKDMLVLNDTKVLPAKIWGEKEGKTIEFLFIKQHSPDIWEVLCRPARKINIGDTIYFENGYKGKIIDKGPEGRKKIHFFSNNIISLLKKTGYAPLPPYIKREEQTQKIRKKDIGRYQTVFARKEGAIAAPTAGLHFTPEILKKIQSKGVSIQKITLDVGLATFKPVRKEYTEEIKMLEETYEISQSAEENLNKAIQESKSIVSVGTTTVRALESSFQNKKIIPGKRSTDLFISPGYDFKVIDKLLTNFHLPKSTLLMLVSAFAGLDLIKKAYKEAVQKRYRFFSYGDCMFII
ncbi:MAG: tRNA preQ1(34) S-adenosylmethionine ribosyltransferase-isomerase QueA [Candidatus Aminicenantaceae bacterium]